MIRIPKLTHSLGSSLLALGILSASCGSDSDHKDSSPAPNPSLVDPKHPVQANQPASEVNKKDEVAPAKDRPTPDKRPSPIEASRPVPEPIFQPTQPDFDSLADSSPPLPDSRSVWPEELRSFHESRVKEIKQYFNEHNDSGFRLRQRQFQDKFKNLRLELREALLNFDDQGFSIEQSKQVLLQDVETARNKIDRTSQQYFQAIKNMGKAHLDKHNERCNFVFDQTITKLNEQKNAVMNLKLQNKSLPVADQTAIVDQFTSLQAHFESLESSQCHKELKEFYPSLDTIFSELTAMLTIENASPWLEYQQGLISSSDAIEARRQALVAETAKLTKNLGNYKDLEIPALKLTQLMQELALRAFHESLNQWYWDNLCTSPWTEATDVSTEKICGLKRTPVDNTQKAERLAEFKEKMKNFHTTDFLDSLMETIQNTPATYFAQPYLSPMSSQMGTLLTNKGGFQTGVASLKDTLKGLKSDSASAPYPYYKDTYLFDSLAYIKVDASSVPYGYYKDTYLFDSLAYIKVDSSSAPYGYYKDTYLFDSLAYIKVDSSSAPYGYYKDTYLFDSLAYIKIDSSTAPYGYYKDTYFFDCVGYTLDTENNPTQLSNCFLILNKVKDMIQLTSANLKATETSVKSETTKHPGLFQMEAIWKSKLSEAKRLASDFGRSPLVQRYASDAPRRLSSTAEALVLPLLLDDSPNSKNFLLDRIQKRMTRAFGGLY